MTRRVIFFRRPKTPHGLHPVSESRYFPETRRPYVTLCWECGTLESSVFLRKASREEK